MSIQTYACFSFLLLEVLTTAGSGFDNGPMTELLIGLETVIVAGTNLLGPFDIQPVKIDLLLKRVRT